MKLRFAMIAFPLLLMALNVHADTAVNSANCSMVFTVRLAFVGNGTSGAFVQMVKDAVNSKWNDANLTCTTCKCKVKVNIETTLLGAGKTCADVPAGWSCVNVIDTAGGPHRSFVYEGKWEGGKINASTSEFSSTDSANILAHELGHYLGLDDEYEDFYCYYVKDSANRTVSGPNWVRKADYNDTKKQEIRGSTPANGSIVYCRNGDGGFEISRPKDGIAADSLMASIDVGAHVMQSHVDILKSRSGAQCPASCCCGNGVIDASVGEECDTAAIPNGCQQGAYCTLGCKCIPYTVEKPGTGTQPNITENQTNYTQNITTGNQTQNRTATGIFHGVCDTVHQVCTQVAGAGASECAADSDCVHMTAPQPVCRNGVLEPGEACDTNADCVKIISGSTVHGTCSSDCTTCTYNLYCGDGIVTPPEQCENNSQCQSGYMCSGCSCVPIPTHGVCDTNHQVCNQVQGAGTSECSVDADCAPPVVDCGAYCSSQGFSQNLGSSYATGQECSAAAQTSPTSCFTTCTYTKFYTASNNAGSTTCCCKATHMLACTDCPGQNPTCPSQTACSQYAPGGG